MLPNGYDTFYNLLKNSPVIELVVSKELVVVNPTQWKIRILWAEQCHL